MANYHDNNFLISNEVTCEKPLLTVDKQMGLNIVHPEGKVWIRAEFHIQAHYSIQPAKTVFNKLFYDPVTDTSVLHCEHAIAYLTLANKH
jgi:tRNA pseudouridine synthase 9